MQKISTLGDLMAEYEAERLAEARKEMEKEQAAWDALPQSEKDRIFAEREAKWEALEAAAEEPDDDEDEEDEEDGEELE